MYKKQMILQRILCYAFILAATLVFVYSLGLMTDLYDNKLNYYAENIESPMVAGTEVYYHMQGFNQQFTKAGIVLILLAVSQFVFQNHVRRKYYIAKRDYFNTLKVCDDEGINIAKAALMIFLNKTCFNGLFRVNKKGAFNVPMGAYKNPMICDEANLRAVSEKLQNVTIVCGDYRDSADFIDEHTFVYFDPPYRPLTATSSFTAYTENLFNDEEQIELAKFVDAMDKKGAKIVVSNSDPKNANEEDEFFDEIYASHTIRRVEASRMINSNSSARGKIKELLITNF